MTGNNTLEQPAVRDHYAKRLSLEEYFVDFLGGLVPGILFVLTVPFALTPPLHALMNHLASTTERSVFDALGDALGAAQNTPATLWIMVFVAMILVSYVIGHLFYRYDPKVADRNSFSSLAQRSENDTDEKRRRNLACASVEECEFPYPYYHMYLRQRGLDHLLPFCVWSDDQKRRSKVYINLLKARLRFHFPDKCGIIIRNEGHVRLASSTWYASIVLMVIAVVGLVVAIGSVVAGIWSEAFDETGAMIAWHLPAIVAPTVVLATSWFALRTIRRFLHYQRLREVFFVLEVAFIAFRDQPHLLDPPFSPQGSTASATAAPTRSPKQKQSKKESKKKS